MHTTRLAYVGKGRQQTHAAPAALRYMQMQRGVCALESSSYCCDILSVLNMNKSMHTRVYMTLLCVSDSDTHFRINIFTRCDISSH